MALDVLFERRGECGGRLAKMAFAGPLDMVATGRVSSWNTHCNSV